MRHSAMQHLLICLSDRERSQTIRERFYAVRNLEKAINQFRLRVFMTAYRIYREDRRERILGEVESAYNSLVDSLSKISVKYGVTLNLVRFEITAPGEPEPPHDADH